MCPVTKGLYCLNLMLSVSLGYTNDVCFTYETNSFLIIIQESYMRVTEELQESCSRVTGELQESKAIQQQLDLRELVNYTIKSFISALIR